MSGLMIIPNSVADAADQRCDELFAENPALDIPRDDLRGVIIDHLMSGGCAEDVTVQPPPDSPQAEGVKG